MTRIEFVQAASIAAMTGHPHSENEGQLRERVRVAALVANMLADELGIEVAPGKAAPPPVPPAPTPPVDAFASRHTVEPDRMVPRHGDGEHAKHEGKPSTIAPPGKGR